MDGKLISIEGIDGSGKTSLVENIKNKLNKDIIYTKEPTDYSTGRAVKRFINAQNLRFWHTQTEGLYHSNIDPLSLAFLFLADHSEHISRLIKPSLEQGKNVIVDRYIDSRYAYQGITLKKYFDDPIEWLKKIHSSFSIKPDYTILLTVNLDLAVERIEQRDQKITTKPTMLINRQVFKPITFEKREFLEKVQENYLKLAREEPERFIKIDANRNIKYVEEELIKELSQILDLRFTNL